MEKCFNCGKELGSLERYRQLPNCYDYLCKECFMKIEQVATKPPIGVMPRHLWLENRRREVLGAIKRYSESPVGPTTSKLIAEWAAELMWLDALMQQVRTVDKAYANT